MLLYIFMQNMCVCKNLDLDLDLLEANWFKDC